MKTRALPPLLLALVLTLCACAPALPPPGETAESGTPAPVAPETPPVPVTPLPLDYGALEEGLPAALWEAFSCFLPVLRDSEPFSWTLDGEAGTVKSVTLAEFSVRHSDAGTQPWVLPMELECLALLDMDGDGALEPILGFRDWGGYYLILKREEDAFCGLELSHRAFELLQRNGVFAGAGGAGYHSYYALSFTDGLFQVDLLGTGIVREGGGEYEVGGRSVSAEEFGDWLAERMVGDAGWYSPEGRLAEAENGVSLHGKCLTFRIYADILSKPL